MVQGEIAIVGMSCLFPGAQNLDAYWCNILGKVDATSDPPAEAWDPEIHYDPNSSETDRVYCKRGGYLGPLAYFDPLAHGIPPLAVGGEPDQWLALQLARDALADAGYGELEEQVRLRTAIVLGKGTYLNTGNLSMVQHGLVISQTLEILKNLHPEYTEAELETIRQEFKQALPPVGPETVPGLIPNVIVGRIANRLDLMGPTYTVDAACASSLIAVQLAMQDLLNGKCDLALVGGSQVSTPVPILNVFCQLGALSRREQIRPFDKDADGTLLGEGIGMVVLKRLADAERNGDRIYAVVKGVGVASDGRGVSVMAPRVEGEVLALRRAYEEAAVSPETVGLVEAHGTGTPLGDVVEVKALTSVFGERQGGLPRRALGSVKSMISHTMPAAGIAGMIKTALALYHKVLPPTLHCENPNPKLELEKSSFYINTDTRPWIHGADSPRRAGVNAFGFGGINAHVVLEEYRGPSTSALATHLPPQESEVCILEAETREALLSRVGQLHQFLTGVLNGAPLEQKGNATEAGVQIDLQDVAYTLNQQLGAVITDAVSSCRLAVVATSLHDLQQKLSKAARRLEDPECRQIKDVSGIYFFGQPLGREGKLAFLFPGEGSQYPNMLADLCLRFPDVRACFDQVDRIFANHPRGYVPSDYIHPRPAFTPADSAWVDEHLWQMDGAIEAVLTSNQAILTLLSQLGLQPDVVVGHSTGEYSAMRAAGILNLDGDEQLTQFALELNRDYEAAATREAVPRAAMLAVAAERQRAEAIAFEAGGEVFVAMTNCPHQTVLVGTREAVERALEIVRREGLIYEYLAFDRAYHTHLFHNYSAQLKQAFERLQISPPRLPIYSCTTADRYPEDSSEIRELMVEHWVRPVEFQQTIERLYADGVRLFVEAGPRGNLTSFVEDILRGRRFCAVPANTQRRSGITQLNHLVALLSAHGVTLNLSHLYQRRQVRQISWDDADRDVPLTKRQTRLKLTTGFPMVRFADKRAELLRTRADHDTAMVEVSHAQPVISATELPVADVAREAAFEDLPAEEVRVAGNFPQPIEAASGPSNAVEHFVAAPETASFASGAAGPSSTPLLQDYLASMEQFLTTQQDVMHAYLQTCETETRQEDNVIEPPLYSADFPLLGQPVTWKPEEYLVTQRVFDPAEDLYLRDHTLGRAVSDEDPELLALAVMPLTMSLEMLAEAAACLLPDHTVIGMREIRAHRWIAFEGHPQILQISALRLSPVTNETGQLVDRVSVHVRNLTEDHQRQDPVKSPVVEAVVLVSGSYPPAPMARSVTLEHERPSRWTRGRLYTDVMFHGPNWQGVLAIERTGTNGCLASLPVLSFDSFFRNTSQPRFTLDPVVLDAAGQVIGFWTMEHLSSGRVIFPYRVDALDFYGGLRPTGELATCLATIETLSDQHVRSDIDIADANGRVWMRLVGWEDKRFDLPERFYRVLLSPRMGEVSETCSAPTASVSQAEPLVCRRVSLNFTSDKTLWKQVWAHCVLSRRERDLFDTLRAPERRQFEWLAGRTAAKDAVRQLMRDHYGLDLLPADIEIYPDERGRPHVRLLLPATWVNWLGVMPVPPVVSISHSDGEAVALASWPLVQLSAATNTSSEHPPLVGVDIERLRKLADGFRDLDFHEGEVAVLETAIGSNRETADEWVLRAWCAKEAIGKALGYGLVDGARSIDVLRAERGTGTITVRLAGTLARAFPDLSSTSLIAYTSRVDDLVVATAVLRSPVGRTETADPALDATSMTA